MRTGANSSATRRVSCQTWLGTGLPCAPAPLGRRAHVLLLGRYRLSKDYERFATSAVAFIYLVGVRLLLARLTRGET